MNKSIALILAGGIGSRMQLSMPKQFVAVDGRTILQHTMLAFQQHQLISAIYVVTSPQWHEDVRQQAKEAGINKFAKCIEAGNNSFMSAKNGIKYLQNTEDKETVVLIHDAVRPLVSQDIISRNIAVCLSRGNAITAMPSQESYMVIDGNCGKSDEFISREHLLMAQTPHTFKLGELTSMMLQAEEKGIEYSQSIFTLANELGHTPLFPAEGEMINFKITIPSDITIFQAILREIRG